MKVGGEGPGEPGARIAGIPVKWLVRGVIAVLVIGFFVFRDQLPEINTEEIIGSLADDLGSWTYLLVGGLAFLETGAFIGLIAPGEFTVLVGGAVAAQGEISLPLILGITWLSAFLGDSVSFALGARLGRGFMVEHGGRVGISEERLEQVESYFARHGGKTILIGRFIGLVRALAPFIAGSSKMRYGAFAPYSILGTGIWATILILAGYFASQSLDEVASVLGRSLFVLGFLVFAVLAIVMARRHLRVPENRRKIVEALEARPVLRPVLAVGRRVSPQVRFLGERLTPGGLGLEFTTLMAALAVALFVLVSYWTVIADAPGPTGADSAVLDFFDEIRASWLDDLARAVTNLGSTPVVLSVGLLTAAALIVKRRYAELAVLVGGMLVTLVGVHAIKGLTDRPRPDDSLVGTVGSAFPSGHAAHAVIYTWIAVTLAVRVVPGITRRGLVILAGVLITVAVGISRVYLRAHWLSDVSAGWGLGVAAYASVAAVLLIAAHIRHNQRDDPLDDHRERPAAGTPRGRI